MEKLRLRKGDVSHTAWSKHGHELYPLYKEIGTLMHPPVHPLSPSTAPSAEMKINRDQKTEGPSFRAWLALLCGPQALPSCPQFPSIPNPRPERAGLCLKSHSKPGAELWLTRVLLLQAEALSPAIPAHSTLYGDLGPQVWAQQAL